MISPQATAQDHSHALYAYKAFHALLGVSVLAQVVVNLVLGYWLLVAANAAILASLAASCVMLRYGRAEASRRFLLVFASVPPTVLFILFAHLVPAGLSVQPIVLPYLLTVIILAGLFARRRSHVVTVIVYAVLGAAANAILSARAGLLTLTDAITTVSFLALVAAGGIMLVSVRLRLEAERDRADAAAAARSEFLARMTHEVRTPLSAATSLAELTARTEDPEERRELSARLTDALVHMRSVVDDILDLQRMEAVGLTLAEAPFSPRALLGQVHELFSAVARERKLELKLDAASDLPESVVGDARRLRQVLFNLVNNALKFTEQGEVVVSCRRVAAPASPHSADPASCTLEFTVSDTGPGIDPESRTSLVAPFGSGSEPGVGREQGSGLGLEISRRFVEMMGATLDIESGPHGGTTVRFAPRFAISGVELQHLTEPDPVRDVAPLGEPGGTVADGLTVLLAEDDAITRIAISEMLRRLGCCVLPAANGREAVEILIRSNPDLVIMDQQMPILDGAAAITEIRAREGSSRTPVIALTAYVDQAVRTHLEAAGADRILLKPVSGQELHAAVTTATQIPSRGGRSRSAARSPAGGGS